MGTIGAFSVKGKVLFLLLICCAARALAQGPTPVPEETSATAMSPVPSTGDEATSSSAERISLEPTPSVDTQTTSLDEPTPSLTPSPSSSTPIDSEEPTPSVTPSPSLSTPISSEESTQSSTPSPSLSTPISSEESTQSSTPSPSPSTPISSEAPTQSSPPSPSSSVSPRPTPTVNRVVVQRVQLTVMGVVPSELNSLLSALVTAVEGPFPPDMVDIDFLQSPSCGPTCFELDFVVTTTEALSVNFPNETVLTNGLSAFLPNATIVTSDFQLLQNTDPACFDFTGINYDCSAVSLACPPGLACVPASDASTQVPCECNAFGNLSDCSGFIANVCSTSATTTTPPTASPIPSWVIPVAVCVGAALLLCLCLMCIICCMCCCYRTCGKSKRTVYLTQGQKGYVPASSPYTASLYKDDHVTVCNVNTVDGDEINMTERETEERVERVERERLGTTSDTFKLGWLNTPPTGQDTHNL